MIVAIRKLIFSHLFADIPQLKTLNGRARNFVYGWRCFSGVRKSNR